MASYNVNYDDERFTQLEQEKQSELNKYNQTYDALIGERNQFTNQQQNLVDQWQQTQEQIANDNLNHQINLYNQQKEQAEKDYQKEAKASYIDYQKETDRYGVSREQMAQNGLSNSGYSESSKVNMYNTYQNRIASARQSKETAMLEFNNAIEQAKLTNNATLAENALTALQQKLNIALEGFNYRDTATQNKLNWEYNINNNYYDRYKDVESQINYENQQAEAIRQYQEQMAFQKEQAALEQQRWERELAYQKQQDAIRNAQNWAQINASKEDDLPPLDEDKDEEENNSNSNNDSSTNIKSIAQSSGWTSTSISMSQSNTTASAKKYGTFSNGYQPKGISGYGKLSKSGHTCTVNGKEQNIWLTTGDGVTRAWYWDGSTRTYVGISW